MWLRLGRRCKFGLLSIMKSECVSMTRQYFGTDGIRGRVGQAPISPEFFMRLAQAVGQHLLSERKQAKVVIGKDTRNSGYMLESALESGFNSVGVDVVLLGPLPTPAVAHLTRAIRADLGVVISASHNPYEDNGIKFFGPHGGKLDDAWEKAVESRLNDPVHFVSARHIGKARRLDDAAGRYIEFCKSTFPAGMDLKGLHIVVDAANGAAYQVAPTLFKELGAEVSVIGNSPDGLNINLECGATHPSTVSKAVLSVKADLGLALDGDADRLIMADQEGKVRDGDQLLYAIAKHRQRTSQGQLSGVVGTLMSNFGLEQALHQLGYEFLRAKVGDRYILEALQSKGWQLGGESSGHLLCLDKHTAGDGLISALQVLVALRHHVISLKDWLSDLYMLPQHLINVRLPAGFEWSSHEPFIKARTSAEGRLGDSGRLLIRPSGTEPLLRIMVEHPDDAVALSVAKEIAECLPSESSH